MNRRELLALLAAGASPLPLAGCPRPQPITVPGSRRFEHPESERELVQLVEKARELGLQLRVRGSLHSVSGAIFTDPDPSHLNVQLDRYNRILAFDEARKQVTVQAGIHLGVDPLDPASRPENSLLYQLERRGWALPDLGGITHQTVGGFLSTGSAGGTVCHDVGDSVVCLRVVAGDGRVYELRPNPGDPLDAERNPFYGAGVSMGLCGILSTVTFQCVERYDIIGKQVTTRYRASPVELFADGPRGLEAWMRGAEYNRALIWPQRGVQKLQLWEARRTTPADAAKTHRSGRFAAKPLAQVPQALQRLVYEIYRHVDRSEPPYPEGTAKAMESVINTFVSDGTEEFWGAWLDELPMDNKVNDRYLPTEFTELFVSLPRTGEVLRALRDFWAADQRMDHTGPYATEVYPSKTSRFWMSPSHGGSQVRVDVFWFKTGQTDPDRRFYPAYWELLSKYGFRFHWGKHLSAPDSSTGVAYRKQQLPAFERFLALRERMDPHQIFVTDYWRRHLGIPRPSRG